MRVRLKDVVKEEAKSLKI